MKRNECAVCGSHSLKRIVKFDEMPVFMGVVEESYKSPIKSSLCISECELCGEIQNESLLDLNLVYMFNHNTTIVGDTWKQHFIEFSQFVLSNACGKRVLEIGDPSAKIAKYVSSVYDEYCIYEPNATIDDFDNVKIIKEFFNEATILDGKFNTIVCSHVIEHMYEPVSFLQDCWRILDLGEKLIMSFPNMEWIHRNSTAPINLLHFEHTYYIDEKVIDVMLERAGFEIDNILYFKNHSIFVSARKIQKKSLGEIVFRNLKDNFLSNKVMYDYKINEINNQSSPVYLFSAHVNSQYLLSQGVDNKRVVGILDNDPDKIGKKLYGYDFDIFDPGYIEGLISPVVVASHMGIYFNEIKTQIEKLNDKAIVL